MFVAFQINLLTHCAKNEHVCNTSAGVSLWINFSKYSPNWRADKYFHSPRQETTGQNIERVSKMGKNFARLASGFLSLLANPDFYLHLARLASGYPHP
jgi:hypothetical protein